LKSALAAVLAATTLSAPASPALVPASWRVADTGARGGATYAGPPVDGVGALYLPRGVGPGNRLRVAYLLARTDRAANLARRLGIAAAGDQLSWQGTTPPFAVVVTSARDERALALAMQFAQRALPLSSAVADRAVIGIGADAQTAVRLALLPELGLGTAIAIAGHIPGGLARAAGRAVRAHRVRIYAPATKAGASTAPPVRHELLDALASTFAPASAGRSIRAAQAVAPRGWVRIAAGPWGGTVWQGVIPERTDPGFARASLIYLPPGVDPRRRYPALYLLHGIRGSPYSFIGGLRFAAVADSLIHARRARPFVALMPPAGDTPRFSGEWTGPWERYVVRDVVPWAGRHLPVADAGRARTLAGYSAGAYGSVDIGLRHPGLFGTLESWSGYFTAPRDGSLAHATTPERTAHDPQSMLTALATELRAHPIRFFLSAGRGEARTLLATQAFARKLSLLGLAPVLHVTGGGHHGDAWRAVLPSGLLYAFAR
jgi:enterochelin esterase-like enzyme